MVLAEPLLNILHPLHMNAMGAAIISTCNLGVIRFGCNKKAVNLSTHRFDKDF